ncbi:Methyltransferase domain containing protein [uncultured Caudovirales phage]|uniref:Methyltransferase domain containing protein n=1 Tax=uncultured Caudovirales phage TaxID=2100421 RepID=A0A6J7WUZ7_9CAUD|nr:Methyltransferase domain containing protein [uncultured Caudovirales phage]
MSKTLLDILHEEKLILDGNAETGTDKFTKHQYQHVYQPLFEPYKDKPIRLLEIGVYFGASLIIWDKFFSNADIVGVDIDINTSLRNTEGRINKDRTKIITCDAYTKLSADTLGMFDIIVDDGPHTLQSMKDCINLYLPKVNSGGVLVIEDIPHVEWYDELTPLIPKGMDFSKADLCAQGKGTIDSRMLVIYKD